MRYFYIIAFLCLFLGIGQSLKAQQKKTVTGTVSDNVGGLPSVNIYNNRVAIGTTNADGSFTVSVPDDAVLEFTFIGYKSVKMSVAGKTKLTVKMVKDDSQLKEVTVQGYVSKSKEVSVGSSVKISGKDLQAVPVASITDMLQGKVAGLNIQQNTGSPGMRGSISIRGLSNINVSGSGGSAYLQPAAPLFVVDGVPIDDNSNFQYGFQSAGPGISPISLIPQQDVESIEVLKDASATALYGSRGAYGVILITTKRGNSKVPVIRYNTQFFFSAPPKLRQVIGGKAERDLRIQQILKSDTSYYRALGLLSATEYVADSLNAYYNNSTNWQSYFYRSTYNQNHNLSIDGGDQAFNYKVNFGYFDQKGIQENTGFTRSNLRMNMQYMPSSKFKLYTTINGTLGKNQKGSGNGLLNTGVATGGQASTLLPSPSLFSSVNSVLGAVTTDNDNKTTELNTTTELKYEFVKGLSLTSNFNYTFNTGVEDNFLPSTINGNAASLYTFNSVKNDIYNRNLLAYFFSLKDAKGADAHNFSAYAFTELESRNFKADVIQNNKVVNDFLRGPIVGVDNYLTSLGGTLNNFDQFRSVAFAGNFSYNYKLRYVLDASYRMDRSSSNGPDAGYIKSPSIGVRWNMQNETFTEKWHSWFDYASFKLSYGTVLQPQGNIYDVYGRYVNGASYNGASTVVMDRNTLPNSNLQPTKNTTYNSAFEFGILKNRLFGTLEAYYKQVDNQLREKPLSNVSSFANIKTNEISVVNIGYEATISARIFAPSKPFQWTISVNGAINRDYLAHLPDGVRQFVYLDDTGQSILYRLGQNSLTNYIYNTKGVYATTAEVPVDPLTGLRYRAGSNTSVLSYYKAGDPRFTDLNGDYVLDDRDLVAAGNSQPRYNGGVTMDFRYKNISMQVQGNYVFGRDVLNNSLASQFAAFSNPLAIQGSYRVNPMGVVPLTAYDIWTTPGQVAKYPNPYDYLRASIINPFRTNQTLFQEDGSYFKLGYISVGYTLNQKFTARYGMNRVVIGGTASNVFMITNYSGTSPESVSDLGRDSGAIYPNPRTYTLSLNIEF
ncbi:SusC/RagA family TonB-linked outer membrane protein [Mucilaginibacter mali]|uniref:SusC/RagA family TonB-linked outer membrane protein n=1 Tax=Mucilaginibacter mali TaxID=2740462 RepID=A0A7D4QCD6_9SPHI|nr:SusC/RagA family TonB-linked outer membrane protein [Mucilaginibacter mali]QKJ31084.1 SusC/RagA family TonB-linked outer membrane protein [Mucilaginibacter mali]